MTKKDIHIVFGQLAANVLTRSNVLDTSKTKIIVLNELLNIGLICDINKSSGITNRKKWFINNQPFENYTKDFVEEIDKDIYIIKSLITEDNNQNNLFLWTGASASEIVNTARLLHYSNNSFKNIYTIDMASIPVQNTNGETCYLEILSIVDKEQMPNYINKFEIISKKQKDEYATLWQRLSTSKSPLKYLTKEKEILEVDETYFDTILESFCSKDFQSPARAIGYTLCETDFNVGDSFLHWRIKQLIKEGKLEYEGKLGEMREYKVRKK